MTIDNELIDNLLKDYKKPADLIGENGIVRGTTRFSSQHRGYS